MKKTKYIGLTAAARELDVSESTLQRLTKRGVLPDRRDVRGWRVYDPKQLQRLARKRATIEKRN